MLWANDMYRIGCKLQVRQTFMDFYCNVNILQC